MDGQQEAEFFEQNMYKTCCDVRYRIILTDINMPKMDGVEAAEAMQNIYAKVREDFPERDLPEELIIVAVTAYDNLDVVQPCYDIGMQEVLSKPVKQDALKRTFKKYYFREDELEAAQRDEERNEQK